MCIIEIIGRLAREFDMLLLIFSHRNVRSPDQHSERETRKSRLTLTYEPRYQLPEALDMRIKPDQAWTEPENLSLRRLELIFCSVSC